MTDVLVLYHGTCPDGFGAAFAAWKVFGPRAEYVPMSYGQQPPAPQGRRVFIVDFSFEPEVLAQLEAEASELVLLDHHKSAALKLAGYRCRCGNRLCFDLERSGARLAWEYFHPDKDVPALIRYIEDRDLWRWTLPRCADFLAALDAEGYDFERWDRVLGLSGTALELYLDKGAAMNEKFAALVESLALKAVPVTLLGVQGLAVNAPSEFSSELGNTLACKSGTFGMVWHVPPNGRLKVSLRSNKPFEVLALAEAFEGGGGHPQSSSFQVRIEDLPALLNGTLQPTARR